MIESTSILRYDTYNAFSYLFGTAQRVNAVNSAIAFRSVANVSGSATVNVLLRTLTGRKLKRMSVTIQIRGLGTGSIPGDVCVVKDTVSAYITSPTAGPPPHSLVLAMDQDFDGVAIMPGDAAFHYQYQTIVEPGSANTPVLNDTIDYQELMSLEVEFYN